MIAEGGGLPIGPVSTWC